MTVRTAELLMAIATFLASIGLMLKVQSEGLNVGWVEGRGPGAGMWPFWLSGLMALTALATLVRWVRRVTPESRSTEAFISRDTIFIVVVSALSILGFLLLIQYIGTYLALMIFMLFYIRILGKHSWVTTIAFMIGTPIFVYLLFEVGLTKYLPKGLPMFEDGFLVIDDLRYKYF